MDATNNNNYTNPYGVEAYTGASEEEPTIFRQWPRVLESIQRIYVALEYRFHRMTYGVFELLPPRINRIFKIAAVSIVLFFVFPWIQKKCFRADSIYEDTSMLGFSLAPASPRSLREQSVRSYVKQYADIAIEEMHRYGIPASISMAQGIVESRCGESTLASNNNNHFGIKCFKRSCKKGHCSNFTDDSHKDFFRKYNDPKQSWREHSLLLSSGRYKNLKELGSDYESWAKHLQQCGYATDKAYAEKLIETIELYGLDAMDDE